MELFDDKYEDHVSKYGTPDSRLLAEIMNAGFKPIAITVMMCEETFVFKSNAEVQLAWEKFKPEGWWYSLSDFDASREQYVKEMYGGDVDQAPLVYWLDKNFEPK